MLYSVEDERKSPKQDIRLSPLFFTQTLTTHQLHFHPSYSCIFHTGSLGPSKLLFCKKGGSLLNKVFFSSLGLFKQNTTQENSCSVCSSSLLKTHVWQSPARIHFCKPAPGEAPHCIRPVTRYYLRVKSGLINIRWLNTSYIHSHSR